MDSLFKYSNQQLHRLKDPQLRYIRKNFDEHVGMARTAMHNLQWKDAARQWNDILLARPSSASSGYMAEYIRCLRMAGEIKQAEKLAAVNLGKYSDNQPLLLEYAELASTEKKWPLAVERWQRALNTYNNDEVPIKIWQRLASSQRRLNDFQSALVTVGRGLKQHPNSLELKTERARILTKTEKWSLAAKDWRTVITKTPSLEAYVELCTCLRELGKFSENTELLKKALSLFPGSLELKLEEAKFFMNQEAWSKALRAWKEAKALTSIDTPQRTIQLIRFYVSILKRLANINLYKTRIRNYRKNKSPRKYVIYTSFSKGYDQLKLPERPDPRFDYVVFTDADIDGSGIFQVKSLPTDHEDMRLATRYPKMHPHTLFPHYDIAIWMDASLMITGDIMPMVSSFVVSKLPIGCGVHPLRHNIQQELRACIELGKGDPLIMRKQVATYQKEGFNSNELSENGLLLFKPQDKKLASAMEIWWEEVNKHSKRDQLSFNYALWKAGLKWHKISRPPNSLLTNPDVLLMPHRQTYDVINKLERQLA